MALTCDQIPHLPGLDAIRLRAGACGRQRRIRWPYVAENRSFKPWVKGGELVFVTGIGRHRSPDNLSELLYEGIDAGIAGLVILTGDAYIGQLPSTLMRLADDLELPLLEQPYSLPMVTVTEVISREIIAAEQRTAVPEPAALSVRLQARLGNPEALRQLIAPCVGQQLDLLEQLSPMLDAWLVNGGNLTATAAALGSHRNSVRYRLNKLFRLTGLSPSSVSDMETLILARALLRAHSDTTDIGDAP
ncbi:PucR family transcriptional regulator [Marinobacter sp. BGYM27]|uniref:PucR family transcriptional regulator n=1 Tax=Marinobacter sp. BGYM27 TaxID=2975597 RepID=UPI0021A72293|nr:PucR family transcriptional regulator [Marinobacter sp. BGYM27]MDG5499480.1 PucR family transcriptional regulator [Marinobacter sp. BGYM27]